MSKSNQRLNKKSNKSSNKRSTKRKNMSSTHKNQNNSSSRVMHGGDDGRFVLPPSYFGAGQNGYVADASPLSGAVSQGTITANGQYAGPNLYPSAVKQTGGGCGCGSKRRSKSKTKKSQKSKKSKKSKSKSKI